MRYPKREDSDEDSRSDISVDGVWDIETEDWTKFVCGGLLSSSGEYRAYTFKNEREYFDALVSHGGYLWAHNGGRFDNKWLLDHALNLGYHVKVIKAGARIISMQIDATTFCDSAALVPVSLKELTSDNVEYTKLETSLPCVCGNDCGGYCSINRRMDKALFNRLLHYLKHDCFSLLEALRRVRAYADSEDLDLSLTIGASAWKNVKRRLNLDIGALSASNFKFVRSGYYGGRVQVFRPKSPMGYEYDVNSMYPSRLAFCAVPVGRSKHIPGSEARLEYRNKRPGVYRCTVHVPEGMHVPPLPFRERNRIYYPVGSFSGIYARPEIAYAQSLGVKIEIHEAHVWEAEEIIFRKWIDKLFALRLSAPGGKKGSIGTWIKLYLNSLTGKFGSKAEQESLEINPPDIKVCACTKRSRVRFADFGCACGGRCCVNGCDGWCGAHIKLDSSGRIWGVRKWRIPGAAHPEWASYLTAEARIEWHKQAIADGQNGESLVYGDTDSIFVETPRTARIGDDLGQWQLQGTFRNFSAVAPKVYYFDKPDGGKKVKAKGIRLPKKGGEIDADAAIQALETGGALGGSAVVGVQSGARNGKFFTTGKMIRRTAPKLVGKQIHYGDRILEPGAVMTRPRHISEILK